MKSIKVCEYSWSRSFHYDLILQDQASGERSQDQWSSGFISLALLSQGRQIKKKKRSDQDSKIRLLRTNGPLVIIFQLFPTAPPSNNQQLIVGSIEVEVAK